MTREKAIIHMTLRRDELKHSVGDLDEDIKAFDMAIKALVQEPCTDAISREKALQIIRAWFDREATPSDLKNEIEQLPPVTPQYTDAEIQKMQDLEFAEIQKAYEIGKAENIEVLDKIRAEIVHLHDWAFSREEILRIIDKYKTSRTEAEGRNKE